VPSLLAVSRTTADADTPQRIYLSFLTSAVVPRAAVARAAVFLLVSTRHWRRCERPHRPKRVERIPSHRTRASRCEATCARHRHCVISGILCVTPSCSRPLPRIEAFVPIYESILALNDLVTACFLIVALRRSQLRALLFLASGTRPNQGAAIAESKI
jgi:hypothetical protein